MTGHEMRIKLNELEHEFQEKYIPKKGRYVKHPAIANESGFVYIPQKKFPVGSIIAAAAVLVGFALLYQRKKTKSKRVKVK
jgi:hypothetical protein